MSEKRSAFTLLGQRNGPDLEFQDCAGRSVTSSHVKRCACADAGPQSKTFPAIVRDVESTIEPFGQATEWIRNTQHNPLAVLQCQETLRRVSSVDGCVAPESRGIELIDPGVVTALGASAVGDALHLRQRFRIEGPA